MGVGCALEWRAVHHIVDTLHQPIFKRNHERDGLHDRSGLETAHSAGKCLAIFAVDVFDVGYGLDFACGHLHEYGCAPFGAGIAAYLQQLLLEHILEVDVDCGLHVVSAACGLRDPVADPRCESDLLGISLLSVEQGVEVLFEARVAVEFATLILIDTPDASVGHPAVGVDADIAFLHIHRVAESLALEVAQIWE